MRLTKFSALLVISLTSLATLAGACSSTEEDSPTGIESARFIGPDEKADNFRSESAQEYFVRGTTTITLGEEFADSTEDERLQAVRDLIPYKQVVIQYFLNTYLIDKSGDEPADKYGGFKALTKKRFVRRPQSSA